MKVNEKNRYYLDNYRFICKNKGLTDKSIEAICDTDLRVFLEWLGDKCITDVSHIAIQNFLMYCGTERANGDKAINRKHTNISMFYKRLIIHFDLDIKNPVDKVDKPKIRKTVRPFLSCEEYSVLMKFLNDINDIRGQALCSLFFSSGCRLSEIWQLNKDSLDFSTRRFIVTGKGQKQRTCMFNPEAAHYVSTYINTRKDSDVALFISKFGTRLSKKAIQDYLKRLGIRAGIEKRVHPHLFRHARAMQLLQDGAKLETIQRLLGHESIATTQIYAHMMFDDVQSEVDRIDVRYVDMDLVAA